jgi:hypothetical protein
VNEEPDPAQLIQEPKPFNSVTYWLLRIVAIIFAVFFIAAISAPMVISSPKKSKSAEAISNSKQIGLALYEFESDYGAYPNKETSVEVTESFPDQTYNLSGNSSNALFLQLFTAEIVRSEEIFYAGIKDSKEPDGIITPGEALKKGEVGFSYIYGLTSKDDPLTPLILTPLIPGTTKFDPKSLEGKAIIHHINYSTVTYEIHKDGRVYDKDGLDILSPKHPVWKGKAPDIRYPE